MHGTRDGQAHEAAGVAPCDGIIDKEKDHSTQTQVIVMYRPTHGPSLLLRRSSFALCFTSLLLAMAGCADGDGQPDEPSGIVELRVEPAAMTLEVGEQVTLGATAVLADGSTQSDVEVEWVSEDPLIASVDGGSVLGLAPGEVRIHADLGSLRGTASITVERSRAVRVDIEPAAVELAPGETAQLSASAVDRNDGPISDPVIEWSVGDEAIATIDTTGLVTAIAPGSTTVTAATEDVQASIEVTVLEPPGEVVDRVEIDPPGQDLYEGTSIALVARAFDAQGNELASRPVTWSSDDPAILSVDEDGTAHGHSVGLTTVRAQIEDVIGTAELRVVAGAASVTIEDALSQVFIGQELQLRATALARDGSVIADRPPLWTSSDEQVALVDEDGLVRTMGGGTVLLRAALDGVFDEVELTVIALRVDRTAGSGSHVCGLTGDGTAYCWKKPFNRIPTVYPTQVGGDLRFVELAVGQDHICGRDLAGAVWCAGADTWGQLGNGPAGDSASFGPVVGGHAFTSLVAGDSHTCGITTGGSALCWGNNFAGELGVGDTLDRHEPTPVAGGHLFTQLALSRLGTQGSTCGIATTGAAFCWGDNSTGQLGDGTATGSSTPLPVAGGHQFTQISIAAVPGAPNRPSLPDVYGHACGISVTGEALCWGYDHNGALGNGTADDSLEPTAVVGSVQFAEVQASGFSLHPYSCGRTSEGRLWCWGTNASIYDPGAGTANHSPLEVAAGRSFDEFVAGTDYVCGMEVSGILECWGSGIPAPMPLPGQLP